jgi:hypothetical protein
MGRVMRVMRILWNGYTDRGYFWKYMWVQDQMRSAESWGFQSALAHTSPSIPTRPSAAMEVAINLVREVGALSMRGVPVEYGGAEFGRVVEVLYETGEVAKAAALVLAREVIDRYIRPISEQLSSSSGRGLGKLEGRLRELVGFVTSVLASEFPIPKDLVPEGALRGVYEVVGDYVVVKYPFDPKAKKAEQMVPKEVLDDKDLYEVLLVWMESHDTDALYRWLAASPGDAILYSSISKGVLPGAVVLSILSTMDISPDQLNWVGLLNELDRLDGEIKNVKARIKETKDKGEKAKLKEELERLKDERERVLDALITWANAIESLKPVLQKEEWKAVYNSLPKRLRDFIDTAKDPRDSFEEFLKRDGLKIMALVDKERRRSGKAWVSVDDVGEARGRLRKYVPMLDKLIEPVMAKLINEVSEGVSAVLNRLGVALGGGLLVSARQSAESARGLLGQALDRLGVGDLDGAINAARAAIEDLRDAAIKEGGGWVDGVLSDVGRLNELVNKLAVLNALSKLAK